MLVRGFALFFCVLQLSIFARSCVRCNVSVVGSNIVVVIQNSTDEIVVQ
jgi:hypothetical protein